MKNIIHTAGFFVGLVLVVASLYACATKVSMPSSHPEKVVGVPICSDCHTGEQAVYDHTAGFRKSGHGAPAARQSQVCGLCHKQAFCADCHANKEELKPGDKYKDNPERVSPHRGDYLSQHKIDGRINPISCMKCHGRTNNARCKSCHR
jgi:ribosomal protein L31